MRISEFKILNKEEQECLLFNGDNFILKHTERGINYALYKIDNFFVEITFQEDSLKVDSIESFVDGKLLDKYYKLIKIHG